MKIFDLSKFKGGWLVGNFEPAIVRAEGFEVGIKYYKAGVKEPLHVHKIATEITVLVSGKAMINGKIYEAGQIIVLEPGEPARFETLEDTATAVIKVPSAPQDKYILE
jgi:hypothetical protein